MSRGTPHQMRIFTSRRSYSILIVLLMSLILASPALADSLVFTLEAGDYRFSIDDNGNEKLEMDGFGSLTTPGAPALPSKVFAFALPPGVRVVDVRFDTGKTITVPGTHRLAPSPRPIAPSTGSKPDSATEAIRSPGPAFTGDTPYGEFVNQGGCRRYNVVQVRYTPIRCSPQRGELTLCPRLGITVRCEPDEELTAEWNRVKNDAAPGADEYAASILENFEQAGEWYPDPDVEGARTDGFLIITPQALENAVQPLENWERIKGRTVTVVTVEAIDAAYTDADRAAEIRHYLRDNWAAMGLTDVLLVGGYADVPMRYCHTLYEGTTWLDVPTDFYYAELSGADNATWNIDGDSEYGTWGEDSIDFIAEVSVGRICWDDPDTVERICRKSADFEYSPYMGHKHTAMLLGAFMSALTDSAELMDRVRTDFFLPDGWTTYEVYEDGPTYHTTFPYDYAIDHDLVVDLWGSVPFGYVFFSGHGAPDAFLYDHTGTTVDIAFESADSAQLNDLRPSIAYAVGCNTTRPEVANNLPHALLEQGGVCFVGATRESLHCVGWSDPAHGWVQTLGYYFTENIHDGLSTVGEANRDSLRRMFTDHGWDNHWWGMFEFTLHGNPDLLVNDRPTSLPDLGAYEPTGWTCPLVPRSSSDATAGDCALPATLAGGQVATWFNWAYLNGGSSIAPFHHSLVTLDGKTCYEPWIGWLNPGQSTLGSNAFLNFGPLTVPGGRHTLCVAYDSQELVWEEDEGNNGWGHQFVWSPVQLFDDVPRTAGPPPEKDAFGCATGDLYDNCDGYAFTLQQSHPDAWWSAVGMIPASISDYYTLKLWDIGDYAGSTEGFGAGELVSAPFLTGWSNFILANDNTSPAGEYYVGMVNQNAGSGQYRVEESTSTKIFLRPDTHWNDTSIFWADNVLDIFEVYLPAETYRFDLDMVYGACNVGMALYDRATTFCSKLDFMTGGYADAGAGGEGETMTVDVDVSGQYALVVFKSTAEDFDRTAAYRLGVTPRGILVTSPDGGENWVDGEIHDIKWDVVGPDVGATVKVELSRDGGSSWETLTASTSNDGSLGWLAGGFPSTRCRIRVTSNEHPEFNDTSNANFTVSGASGTLHAYFNCSPAAGTLPFRLTISPQIFNIAWHTRRYAAHIDVTTAGGQSITNWRAGYTNIAAQGSYEPTIWITLQDLPGLHGANSFVFYAEDVTPAPYNQPPFPAAGDADGGVCSVTGN